MLPFPPAVNSAMNEDAAVDIRIATSSDAAAVAQIYAPAVLTGATSFELVAPDATEMAARIRRTLERTPWLVCVLNGQLAGYAYASRHRDRPAYQWSVEVSAYVRPDVQRSGVGSALYTSLFEVLRLQGFRTALAGITVPNPASVGLHAALGFATLGVFHNVGYKNGTWHDVKWMELALLPLDAEPAAPVPLPDLLDTAALSEALQSGTRRITMRP